MKIDTVRKHAMSFDAVTGEPHHDHSSFRARGKIFLTVPPGDALLHVFVGEEDREPALALAVPGPRGPLMRACQRVIGP